jgi:hypothetical protein
MAGHALLDQQALPNWLAGQPVVAPRAPVPSGMQARSLVDDHLLPKWLRDQPESTGAANVSEWIGASAAQEPMPSFLSEAYSQAPTARAPQPYAEQPYSAAPRPVVAAPPPQAPPPQMPQMPPPQAPQGFGAAPTYNGGGQPGYAEDAPLPEWLRAQAGGADSQMAGGQEAPASFAASDLIDPSALPDWVTQRAPAPQQFSSTHGWSAASPQLDASGGLAGTDYTGGLPATEYAASPGYADAAGAQATGGYMGWDDESSWGGGAQGDMAYDEGGDESPYGRGRPLEPEELPPWLRGQAGAQAAGSSAYVPERNPWMAASQPEAYADSWDEGDGWNAHDGRGEQGWDESAGWGAASGGYDDHARDGGWSDAAARGGWSDQRDSRRWEDDARRQRGPAPRGRGEPPRGYDERYDGAGDEMEYEDQGDPSRGQRGRGWLGFLRRDKR